MVAHGSSDVFEAHLLVRNNPQRHVFRIGILTKNPRQIAVEVVGKTVKETVDWYKAYNEGENMLEVTNRQIQEFFD